MLRIPRVSLILAILAVLGVAASEAPARQVAVQEAASASASDLYEKAEYHIPMRDGVELHTAVYTPKEADGPLPIVMNRTPYSCRPYGPDEYRSVVGPSRTMMEEGYIFVYQDVRGRYMSDGLYDNMRPHVPGDDGIDESSDTYDTIQWLLEHLEGHNGRVGIWGISYPGFYTAAALPEAHPALVAASPQAPISDFYFDDFHHRGAFTLAYLRITSVFSHQKSERAPERWYSLFDPGTRDGYKFYLELGPLKNADRYYGEDAFFWNQLVEHPNYDAFWQRRSILPHLDDIHTAVLTVGGWFDAEDLYGPLNIYQTIERENPEATNLLVMGPWGHGEWSRKRDVQRVGDIPFGSGISEFYQDEVESAFFRTMLKGEEAGEADGESAPEPPLPEALVFDTGLKRWEDFPKWPPREAHPARLAFGDQETLVLTTDEARADAPENAAFSEFLSDPDHPVPYTERIRFVTTPRAYMTEDQRFASRRPDVLSFRSEPLEQDVTIAGPLTANLFVSTTGTDADWVVKLIDVYPSDHPDLEAAPDHVVLGDYEQLVRGEIVRGRYRNSFETPEPFEPGAVTQVSLPLQDVFHTFKKGHQILVHVQSSWFPLFDRNPQTYVPNIFLADEEDFQKATHRVYHSEMNPSHLEVLVLPQHGRAASELVPEGAIEKPSS